MCVFVCLCVCVCVYVRGAAPLGAAYMSERGPSSATVVKILEAEAIFFFSCQSVIFILKITLSSNE